MVEHDSAGNSRQVRLKGVMGKNKADHGLENAVPELILLPLVLVLWRLWGLAWGPQGHQGSSIRIFRVIRVISAVTVAGCHVILWSLPVSFSDRPLLYVNSSTNSTGSAVCVCSSTWVKWSALAVTCQRGSSAVMVVTVCCYVCAVGRTTVQSVVTNSL